jgi:DNA helicase-2/ATP-dependent DNA helicase PcrA
VDNLSEDVDAPTLLTLHSAKGLEFPVVFITGLEEGLLPHSRSFDDPDQMAEERRLMYVGLTRAKDRLYLTRAFVRARYGESDPSAPSRFLDDIPPKLTSGMHEEAQRSKAREERQTRAQTRWNQEASYSPSNLQSPISNPQFRAGQRVRHAVFGEGLVIESRVAQDDEMVSIAFEDVGLKRLMASMANLERLE